MRVILIRHGAAVDSSALGDEGRHLSVRGRQQAAATGAALAGRVPTPTHVWASPLVRAQQTAELVVARFGASSGEPYAGEIEARDDLYSDSTVDGLAEALAQVAANPGLDVARSNPGLDEARSNPGLDVARSTTRADEDPTVLVVSHMPFVALATSALLRVHVSGYATGHAYVLALTRTLPLRATLEWRWTGA